MPSVESYVLAEEAKQGERKRMPRKEIEKGNTVILDRAGDETGPVTGTINMVNEDGTFVVEDEGGATYEVKPEDIDGGTVSVYSQTEEEGRVRLEAEPAKPDTRTPQKKLTDLRDAFGARTPTVGQVGDDQQAFESEFTRLIDRYEKNGGEGTQTELVEQQISKMRGAKQFQQLTRQERDVVDEFLDERKQLQIEAKEQPKLLPAPEPKVEPEVKVEPEPEPGPVPVPIPTEPIQSRAVSQETVTLPTGEELDVEYAVVDMADLTASHDFEGNVNPAYPSDLQPRDRTRKTSQAQIIEMASGIRPALLTESPTADTGAPIIDEAGVVESGNARTLALREAYGRGQAGEYVEYLKKQGYDVKGLKQPVLARIRQSELTPEQRQAFTVAANQSTTARMSRTEQAMADAQKVDLGLLEQYEGGSVDLTKNRPFVRAFISKVVGSTEQASFADSEGDLTAEGMARLEAGLLATAYGDAKLVERLAEGMDPGRKTMRKTLVDIAPAWAKMRQMVKAGTVHESADQTQALMDAVRLMDKSVREERSLASLLNQESLFGEKSPELAGERGRMTEAFLAAFYANPSPGGWTKLNAQAKTAAALRNYVDDISNLDPRQVNMFGEAEKPPIEAKLRSAIAAQAEISEARISLDKETREAIEAAKEDPTVIDDTGTIGRTNVAGRRGGARGCRPARRR